MNFQSCLCNSRSIWPIKTILENVTDTHVRMQRRRNSVEMSKRKICYESFLRLQSSCQLFQRPLFLYCRLWEQHFLGLLDFFAAVPQVAERIATIFASVVFSSENRSLVHNTNAWVKILNATNVQDSNLKFDFKHIAFCEPEGSV